ncbi:MAG: alpha/beta hydrolase [Gammaproteobacteria bacterium]|nr:alpha/beta hydrolase [Gammaproteobacteria bacterium]
MTDYSNLIDDEVWAFINQTNACYPEDTATRSIEAQRQIYNEMCRVFYRGRPEGLAVHDQLLGELPIRMYGQMTPTRVVYFHGGGFVVGDLESHDDVCAELAVATGLQVIAVDYRLSPEHPHPAAYDDALQATVWALQNSEVILAGDSAGANLAAAVSGTLVHKVRGQVLIYPGLGGDHTQGSYLTHATAPLLTLDDIIFYMGIRGGDASDPTLKPLAGRFDHLPPTYAFAAECDPLCDDCEAYVSKILAAGGTAKAVVNKGLVHGHLRARHLSQKAAASFAEVIAAIVELASDSPKR